MNADASDKILRFQALRAQLAVAEPRVASANFIKTGCASIDETIGGLFCSCINESSGGSGSNSLLFGLLLQQALETGTHLAFIDASDAFDPSQYAGSLIRRMLWVRCRGAKEAMRSTDMLIRDGNLPLVILDLQVANAKGLRGIPGSTWHRLARLLETSNSTLLVLSASPIAENVRLRITAEDAWPFSALQEPRRALTAGMKMATRERGSIDRRRTA